MITITALKGAPAFSRLAGSITDASDKPRTQLTNFGVVIEEELHNMCNNYRSLEVMAHVIMPDHLHFILFVHENIDYHVGMAIASLKGTCTQRMRALLGREDASFLRLVITTASSQVKISLTDLYSTSPTTRDDS